MSSLTGVGIARSNAPELADYVIDVRQSTFQVHAFASGLISAIAHSPKFDIREWVGEAKLNPDNPSDGMLTATVNANGFTLVDDVRDSDQRQIFRVMHTEVLETNLYPEIVFDGTWRVAEQVRPEQYLVKAEGGLRLHGVTNPLTFDAEVAIGHDTFRAHGKFKVFQSDFGIKIASIAASTLTLRDDLIFSFFVVGRKK